MHATMKGHCVSPYYRFYDASFWNRQREAFEQQGVDAWRLQQPILDMGTTNPNVAYHFAQVVLAMFQDWANLHPNLTERIYIVDMGAGVGRFAFNMLMAFTDLYQSSLVQLPPYTYVITDITDSVLDFAEQNPRMQPFVEQGVLDFALFDAESSEELVLRHSGRTISPEELNTPLILIGNYFFSSLRRNLFHVMGGELRGVTFRRAPKLVQDVEDIKLTLGEPRYDTDSSIRYADTNLNRIIESYRTSFEETHVTIPVTGIACLTRLAALSQAGFCLLSMDGGYAHQGELDGQAVPKIVPYADTFYVKVNYHALLGVFEAEGALTLKTDHNHDELTSVGLLAVEQPDVYSNTQRAFEQYFRRYGPDDIFEMLVLLEQHLDQMSVEQILGAIRSSRYSPRIFQLAAPRLASLLREQGQFYGRQVLAVLPYVEQMNFTIGTKDNLSYSLGVIYFELALLDEAREKFHQALAEGMVIEEVYFALAITNMLMEELHDARDALLKVMALNPENVEAPQLKAYLETFLT